MNTNKPNKLAYSYLFKFIASIMIAVFTHMNKSLTLFASLPVSLREIPSAMVEFFFIFSGALFYVAYYKKMMEQGNYGEFIKKRFLRIHPILIMSAIWLTLSYFIESCVKGAPFIEPLRAIVTFTLGAANVFTGGTYFSYNGPCWYIGVLLVCYLFACLITFIISKTKNKSILWFLIPVVIGFIDLLTNIEAPLFNSFVIRGYIGFFLGVCLVPLSEQIINMRRSSRIIIKILLAIFALTNLVLIILGFEKVILFSYPNKCIFGLLVVAPLFVVLYGFGPLNKICDNKVMALLGGISFPIYIFNEVIHHTWFAIDKEMVAANSLGVWYVFIDLALHIAVGFGIYYLNKYLMKFIDVKKNKMEIAK